MNLFKLSMLGFALIAAGSMVASSSPNCATIAGEPLIVGVDVTATGPGAPWVSVSSGILVGFDVQVICQVATRLGYGSVHFLNVASANFTAALASGKISAAISDLEIFTPNNPNTQSWVKYNDSFSAPTTSLGKGILLNPSCCLLWANINQAITNMAADGTLAKLRTQFGIMPPVAPNSFSPIPSTFITEATNCSTTTPVLPARNNITNFILNFLCLPVQCKPAAPTTVTTP